jgi:hypothetical protein
VNCRVVSEADGEVISLGHFPTRREHADRRRHFQRLEHGHLEALGLCSAHPRSLLVVDLASSIPRRSGTP